MSKEEHPLSGYPNEGQADRPAASAGDCEVTPQLGGDIDGGGVSSSLRVEATPGRGSASNSSRASIDWNQAYLFYAALPLDRRTYQAVADKFGPSVRTVERHGGTGKWKERARQLDSEASVSVSEQIRDQHAERQLGFLKLIDATNDSYADQLREGTVKVAPRDLATLFRLCTEVLENSETTFIGPSEPTADLDPAEESERKLQVLQALRNAGVLKHFLDLDQDNNATPTEAPNASDGCNVLDEQNGVDEDEPHQEQVA